MYLPNERFTNNFDFLRVIAALCIAFSHSFGLLNRASEDPLMKLSDQHYDFSFIGLCIFFSISGYLITKSAANSASLINYAWKRFLRIQPLLILVTLLSIFVLGPLFTKLTAADYFKQLASWTYLRNVFPATGIQFSLPGVFENNIREPGVNGSLWTLVVEERLYIFTAIVFFLSNKKRKYYLLFIALYNMVYMVNNYAWHFSAATFLKGPAAFYALIFLNAGALYLQGNAAVSSGKLVNLLVLLPLLLLSLVFFQLDFLQVLLIPLFVILVAHVRAFTNHAGRWGDFTYGLYIFAFPVQQIIIDIHNNQVHPYPLFLLTVLVCLPLAVLSWHLLEKTMLALKSRVK
ncbi:MAG: acyltransferase [Ferruginibacter sp.]